MKRACPSDDSELGMEQPPYLSTPAASTVSLDDDMGKPDRSYSSASSAQQSAVDDLGNSSDALQQNSSSGYTGSGFGPGTMAKSTSPTIAYNNIPGFLTKTFEIFTNPAFSKMCGWGANGDTIVIFKIPEFASEVLPQYFKHSNFQSFVRQLNM